ncbi:MAG: hypothetical protein RIC35_13955 [Marinoscillum sp.]
MKKLIKYRLVLVKGYITQKANIQIVIIVSLILFRCAPSKEECETYISREHIYSPDTEKVFFVEVKDQNFVSVVKYLSGLDVSNIGIVSSTLFSDEEVDFFLKNNILISKENVKNTIRRDIDLFPENQYNAKRSVRFTLAGDNHFVEQFVNSIPLT